ncbi:transcriptional regulator family: Fungal Specific TF [Aspergillus niger]|nr:transcriptional regulator family: Fungal Specific TF [Aspergillus niger]KAI2828865.1 transcriptional regulator family: Fungal Specific TF [Aspergillus niger]KAI2838677.1 transcriptional regulator family: Fungal Specific TF [Aspergillus niger]KAI2846142.1 transcriptional regulator family: Fungal Specific TF [Aspergillus niger]KAI2872375.1 transcriptional regulator family: Fungal Specific TF [Aspergillus niger]
MEVGIGTRGNSKRPACRSRKTKCNRVSSCSTCIAANLTCRITRQAQITADSDSSMPNVDNPNLRELEEDTTILGSFCWI